MGIAKASVFPEPWNKQNFFNWHRYEISALKKLHTVSAAPMMSHFSTMAGGMASRCMAVGVVKPSSRSARATGGGVCKDSHSPNTSAPLLMFCSVVQSRLSSLLHGVASPSSLLPSSLSSLLRLGFTLLSSVLCLRHSSAASRLWLICAMSRSDTSSANNVNDMIDHIIDN